MANKKTLFNTKSLKEIKEKLDSYEKIKKYISKKDRNFYRQNMYRQEKEQNNERRTSEVLQL